MHCVTCHGQFLSFKAAKSEDGTVSKTLLRSLFMVMGVCCSHIPFQHGYIHSCRSPTLAFRQLHIAVTKRLSTTSPSDPSSTGRDFVYVRRSTPSLAGCVACVPFVKRRPSKACSLDLQTRRKKMRLLLEAGADEQTTLQFVPGSDVPVRQYFHSRSNEPMLPGEWDVDSDDEDDEGWVDEHERTG